MREDHVTEWSSRVEWSDLSCELELCDGNGGSLLLIPSSSLKDGGSGSRT